MSSTSPLLHSAAADASATVDSLQVDLGERSYPILIGSGLIAEAGVRFRPLLPQPRVVIISDTTVAGLYLQPLTASLEAAGIATAPVIVPPGEASKSFAELERLCDRLLSLRIERKTMLVALGGGVIGDLTGFAAGILLRGLDFIQVPTTLLAQVDSAVGGKTGINTAAGKNLVGLFHQPKLVLADVATLATLDPRERHAGYAEVVKYGLIDDPPFFVWLEQHGGQVLAGDTAAQRHAVMTSCAAKARIVAADEREAGQRALLNLGHTFGHALEAATGFGPALLHGEAVALGMVLAFDLSVRLGLCPAGDALRVRQHFASLGFTTGMRWLSFIHDATPDSLIEHMRGDKKVRDGRLTFVLARGIGQAFLTNEVPVSAVRDLLAAALAEPERPS
jgi:3-dehydroquinate synthase